MGSKITAFFDEDVRRARITFLNKDGVVERKTGTPQEIRAIWYELQQEGREKFILCAEPYPRRRTPSTPSQKMLLIANLQRWIQVCAAYRRQLRAQKAIP